MKKLDIGCGRNKKKGFIGIDKFPHKEVDFVIDIEKEKLPFENNSIDYAIADNSLEHLNSIESILSEVWRVLKKDGHFKIIVPYHKCIIEAQPFHKLRFGWTSFNVDHRNLQYQTSFKIVDKKLIFVGLDFYGIVPKIQRNNHWIYERFLSHWFPARYIQWILIKETGKSEGEMNDALLGTLRS